MSSPDYAQKLTDHQSFLVLVKPLGRRIGASDYGQIYERIRSVQRVCIPADPRCIPADQRCMMVRYKHEYKPEDNDWGDFQFHRRVLGLLCIVQYHADNPMHEVEAHYNSIKSLYGSSLFDSRLILLGVASVNDLPDTAVAAAGGSFSGDLPMKADHFGRSNETSGATDAGMALVQQEVSDSTFGESAGLLLTESSVRHRKLLSDVTAKQLLCYESAEVCLECIADDVRDFACSLFYILDSKRISASKLQVERQPQLLMAPYERRDVAHMDMESKLFKKRYIGRQKKHLGDLCLLAALYQEAGSNYSMALDILKSADDFLWVAGALEGLCCAAFFVNYPSTPEKSPLLLPRNRSFSTKRGPINLFQNFGLKPAECG